MKKKTQKQADSFKTKVLAAVRAIPKGSVLTYKEIASKVGNPKAARAVGTIMAANSDLSVPCHRVIRSDGSIGEYNGLRGAKKAEILKAEGAL